MIPLYQLLFPLSYLVVLISAAANPTSFCKCTCGANSTIIPLDAPSSQHHTRSFPEQSQQDVLPIRRPRDDVIRHQESSPSFLAAATNNGNEPSSGEEDGGRKEGDRKEYRKKTCNDCNKQYCLSQHLHICEGLTADDVFTTCFRASFSLYPLSSLFLGP
ncbi:MAG: hypothetical protein Q9196_006658 [Gyalolechia fulgens]